MKILRTDSTNKDFIQLVKQLDELLAAMDGREHDFYNEYNKIDSIKHVVVAYNGAIPVACGAIKEFTSNTMEVKRMFTCSEFRGNGFATKVLNELETWAEELGYDYCILETGKKLPDAVRLYQKSGYERIPNYGQYVEMENSICFKKHLMR
ncbi:GNAT family N-acetyltransferase [Draconibacterium sediminis]|uniref:GNAT family acetyltransferase n=1 Tax=Draconibacterium sediminis TaxID=1544798 RepID=A0A0D8J8A5_9BACT|nr:GNAT family N-acetyltransferase [Draconibacterium sediminis]KJF43029.1 GNAT family acetyltransferase [Draconibacterium sediminis]